MGKKILVIGAGIAQIDAIVKAREMGYEVYASDGSPEAPGLREAHMGKIIDVKDASGNLAWARELEIDGVLSYASDMSLPTVLSVREALGLPGLGRTPMEVSLDKSRQRLIYQKAGLAQPEFEVVASLQEARNYAAFLGYPLIIKPIDNSGSRGVTLVEKEEAVVPAYEASQNYSKAGLEIMERFVQGLELTLEGFSVGAKHHILAISDKFKPSETPCVATQLAYPAAISSKQEQEVIELICSAYDAVGVDNTPTHSEIILTENGPKLIEIGCRGGGFYVFTRVVQAASEYDIVGNWTRFCAGDPVEEVFIEKSGVVLRFMIARPGKLVQISGMREAEGIEGVEVGSFYKLGDSIPEFKSDGTRTGWMIVVGKTRNEALKKADWISRIVEFKTKLD